MLPAMPSLEARALTKKYDGRTALDAVSFAIDRGEVIAIVGPNGAGKTTLLSIVAGVQKATTGEVSEPENGIGWVPQKAAVYGKLTVRENLLLFARLEKVKNRHTTVIETIERIGLTDRADSRAEDLSGGMRQRVSIGMGLIANPEVLLLDEPTAALDPLQRERLWVLLNSLVAQGISLVYSSHAAGEVQAHADRVLVLDGGKLLFDGPPAGIGPGAYFEEAFINFLRENRADES
jgi:ABC-2 type transport system ATP-binding protein